MEEAKVFSILGQTSNVGAEMELGTATCILNMSQSYLAKQVCVIDRRVHRERNDRIKAC